MENPQSLHSTFSKIHPTTTTKKRDFGVFIHSERICCTPVCSGITGEMLVGIYPAGIYLSPSLESPPPSLSFFSHQGCSSSSSPRPCSKSRIFWDRTGACTPNVASEVDFQRINLILITNCGKYLP